MSDFRGLDAEHVFINATNLALMNAGISLDKTVGAVSCVWDGEGNLTVNGEIGDYTVS
jgi:ribonuclease PH